MTGKIGFPAHPPPHSSSLSAPFSPLIFPHWDSGLDYASPFLFPSSSPKRLNEYREYREYRINRELICSVRAVLMDGCSAARPFIGSAEVESNENWSLSSKPTESETKKTFPCIADSPG